MIFKSVSYLLFFPIVTILYFAFPKKLRNAWLLIASYFFYMNWNAAYGLLLFSSTVITYLCSLLVEWAKVKKQSIKLAKAAMAVSFLLNLGLLFYFKYLNFAIVNLNRISSLFHGRQISAFDILLPVGISFVMLCLFRSFRSLWQVRSNARTICCRSLKRSIRLIRTESGKGFCGCSGGSF